MKNYLSVLQLKEKDDWGGYHNEGSNMFRCYRSVVDHFCPVQTNNIAEDVKTIDIIYNLSECTKDNIEEAKRLIQSMIERLAEKYAAIAQITQKPVVEDIKAVYAGNGTTRFTIRITTPMLKNGKYLVDDILGRYYGNIPEQPGTPCVRYRIKPVAA